jgi:hypothetical protein
MDIILLILLGLVFAIKTSELVIKKKNDGTILKKKGDFVLSDEVESLLIN